jgi:hypothetical protein
LQQIFLRYAFGNSLPKLSPENSLQKNLRNFPEKISVTRNRSHLYMYHHCGPSPACVGKVVNHLRVQTLFLRTLDDDDDDDDDDDGFILSLEENTSA